MTQWIDFKEVKGMATMAGVLEHYGIPFQHKSQIYIRCPLPSHTSKNSGNSLSVNLERNIWSCKSESCIAGRNGKEGGNVLDFVIRMEQCDVKTAAAKIVEWFGTKQEAPNGASVTNQSRKAEVEVSDNPTASAAKHKRVPLWKQKNGSPKIEEPLGGATVQHPVSGPNNPSPLDTSAAAQPVKGYMKDVDAWFDSLISDPPDWKAIKNAVKARLIDSYKNGKAART